MAFVPPKMPPPKLRTFLLVVVAWLAVSCWFVIFKWSPHSGDQSEHIRVRTAEEKTHANHPQPGDNFQLKSRFELDCSNHMPAHGVMAVPAGGFGEGVAFSSLVLGDSSVGGWVVLVGDSQGNVLMRMQLKRAFNIVLFATKVDGEWSSDTQCTVQNAFPQDRIFKLEIKPFDEQHLGIFVTDELVHKHHIPDRLTLSQATFVAFTRLTTFCAEFTGVSCAEPCDQEHTTCMQGNCVPMSSLPADPCNEVDCGGGTGQCVGGMCVCELQGQQGHALTHGQCASVEDRCANKSCGEHGYCKGVSGECFCFDGYSGARCEQEPNRCLRVRCGRHGRCEKGVCLCEDGFSGRWCEVPPNQCQYTCIHGTCTERDSDKRVVCRCDPGFKGESCDLSWHSNSTGAEQCPNIFDNHNTYHMHEGLQEGQRLLIKAVCPHLDATLAIRMIGEKLGDYPIFVAVDYTVSAPVKGRVSVRSHNFGIWGKEEINPEPLELEAGQEFVLEIAAVSDKRVLFILNNQVFCSFQSRRPVSDSRFVQLSPDFHILCSQLAHHYNLRGLVCFWHSFNKQTCFEPQRNGLPPVECPSGVTPDYLDDPHAVLCAVGTVCRVSCRDGKATWTRTNTNTNNINTNTNRQPANDVLVAVPQGAFGVGIPLRPKGSHEFEYKGYYFRQPFNGQESLPNKDFHSLLLHGFNLRGLECVQQQGSSRLRSRPSVVCHNPASAAVNPQISCPEFVNPAYLSIGGREDQCSPQNAHTVFCIATCTEEPPYLSWTVYKHSECAEGNQTCPSPPPFVHYAKYSTPNAEKY